MNLTPRQTDVVVAIRNYRHLHGYSPTMQELADQLGTSKVTIFEHVGSLEKNREELDLEQLFSARKGVYVLRVRGESMIDDHLCDGDFVVIERRETARNGEQVVALLDSGEATLKRFYREGARIRLQPANKTMEPRIVDADRCKVQGVVIGVVRSYSH